MILRARVVLPVSRPPISDGAVVISGDRFVKVGRWRDISPDCQGEAVDLGEMILMPGLINAHCHLDYTGMAGQISPTKEFTDWIKSITTLKAHWNYTDYAQSWLSGAQMLLRTGTTTVADIEAVPELLPDVWSATPLRVFSYLEMTGIKSRRAPKAILKETASRIESLSGERGEAGLSPHAPYSTTSALLRLSAQIARERNWRITTHVAESAPEFEMFLQARGPMFDWLRRNERDMSDCGLGSPVEHLERQGLLAANLLAVHANYLAANDVELLAKRKVSVVHCPRSHAYFGHRQFPYDALAAAGVNVCLGTDSLASVNRIRSQPLELNLFAEMRAFANRYPSVPPQTVLDMATLSGARALGLPGEIGELTESAFADGVAIPFVGKLADVYEAVVHHSENVPAAMIAGQWAVKPEFLPRRDE